MNPRLPQNHGEVTSIRSAPHCRPYIQYPFTKESGWTFSPTFKCRDHLAKLYLTPADRQRGEILRAAKGPYVLIEPHTKHDNFRWAIENWDALVARCPDLTFVQHTHADSTFVAGAVHEPATFREACGLVEQCDVYVRSESGMCHAAAALDARQITLFGGCMDPDVMGGYPGQTVIADRGPGSPCGSWLPCTHCQQAMDRITVDVVIEALRGALRERRAA